MPGRLIYTSRNKKIFACALVCLRQCELRPKGVPLWYGSIKINRQTPNGNPMTFLTTFISPTCEGSPGPGIGGYCLPKDGGLGVWSYHTLMDFEDDILKITPMAIDINDTRKQETYPASGHSWSRFFRKQESYQEIPWRTKWLKNKKI